jgi:hypothetical protein
MSTVYSPRFRKDRHIRFAFVLDAPCSLLRLDLFNVDRTLYKPTIIPEQVGSLLRVEPFNFTSTTTLGNLDRCSRNHLSPLRYCDAFTFKAPETKRVFLDQGTSFLEIHTEYSGSDYEAIRTRIEAFIELVKAKTSILV